jgi:DnaK suppressor protein
MQHCCKNGLAMSSNNQPHLSFKDLLAMPEKAYMDATQLAFFRHLLLSLRDELDQNAILTGEHLRAREAAADPADRATLEEERKLELRTRDRERRLLKKINGALLRIEEGTFGYCAETGESIGLARLYARPTATLSIEAQERHEQRARQFGE